MSIYTNPGAWRMKTPGGIPFCLMEGYPKGSFESEDGEIIEQYIIRSGDLVPFVLESFPPMIAWDERFAWAARRTFPGSAAFSTKRVSFQPFEPGRPCDPWKADLTAPAGTHSQFVRVTIEYGTGKNDPNNPTTFLEVTASAGTDFIVVPGRGNWKEPVFGLFEPVKDLNVPITKLLPETEWSVRWSQVTRDFLPELMKRLRDNLGKINDAAMPLLMDPPPETVLFVGFSMREQYSWRSPSAPPAEVEMKFLEKKIEDAVGDVHGHNHFFRPDEGEFQLLLKPDGLPIYDSADLNDLWAGHVRGG